MTLLFKLALLIDKFYDTAIIKAQRCPVDILPVRVVAYYQHLRLVRIVNIERKFIPRTQSSKVAGKSCGKGEFSLTLSGPELIFERHRATHP